MHSIYLINGNIYHLINKEIAKITNSANVIKFDYSEDGIDIILEEANYNSFDMENKYIVVKNSSLFSTKVSSVDDILLKYMEHPNPKSIIIFITNNVDSRKKIVKEIKEKYSYIEMPKIDYKNVCDYINSYLKEKGYSIEYDASRYIVSNLRLDLDIIYNELDKIILYLNKPSKIDLDTCMKIVSCPFDDNIYHFLDSFIDKKYSDTLKLYRDLKVYKIDEIMIIVLLYKEFKKIYTVKKLYEKRVGVNEIMKELSLQEWQLKKIYNQSLNYSEKELISIIKSLSDIDRQIKTGLLDKEIAIKFLLLQNI